MAGACIGCNDSTCRAGSNGNISNGDMLCHQHHGCSIGHALMAVLLDVDNGDLHVTARALMTLAMADGH